MPEASAAARIYGLIPAAGGSQRMGQPKQLLAWKGSTLLETVITTVLAGEVNGLVVVTTPSVAVALNLDRSDRHLTVILDDSGGEMVDSIIAGVETLRRVYAPGDSDAFLVCPGDLPRMTADIVRACVTAYRAAPGRILFAATPRRSGHPIVVPFALAGNLAGLRGAGLKGLLDRHRDRADRVCVSDDAAMTDVDTPADYDSLSDSTA